MIKRFIAEDYSFILPSNTLSRDHTCVDREPNMTLMADNWTVSREDISLTEQNQFATVISGICESFEVFS